MGIMRRAVLSVGMTWDGRDVPEPQHSRLTLRIDGPRFQLDLDAPFHDDPPPPHPAGRCPELWKHEVVELFLLGSDERYLELEMGPRGHYLALELNGARKLVRDDILLDYETERYADRWLARCVLPTSALPRGLGACNAYSMHGVGDERQHLAVFPVPGRRPDFHRLECFQEIPWIEG